MKLSGSFMNQTNHLEKDKAINEAIEKCRRILLGPRRELLETVLEVLSKEQEDYRCKGEDGS